MINTLIIYYPFISVCAGLSPSNFINFTKVRPSLSTYRAEFSAIITDINYNMNRKFTEIYLNPTSYSVCLSSYIVLCRIPLFLGHNLYNTKAYLTKKCYKTALYIKNYIFKKQIKEIVMKKDYKIAQCGDIIPSDWEWYDDYNNWCEICYEPIMECQIVCYCCANNRVEDGIWREEEKDERAFVDGIKPKGFPFF